MPDTGGGLTRSISLHLPGSVPQHIMKFGFGTLQ